MAHHRHFLIVDSDQRARQVLAGVLAERIACTTMQADCAAAARGNMRGGTRFDAVFLEARLSDGDGRELCRELRGAGLNAPIIMLGTSARETDVVWALDAGASDHVCKPYRTAELLARLRAQLRAFDTSEYAELAVGAFRFRPATRTLLPATGQGRATRLTEKESLLLKHLCRAQGRLVSRETLLREVWGYRADASTHTVETHVYRLRRKIEAPEGGAPLLVSEGGSYRLDLDRGTAACWPRATSPLPFFPLAASGD